MKKSSLVQHVKAQKLKNVVPETESFVSSVKLVLIGSVSTGKLPLVLQQS